MIIVDREYGRARLLSMMDDPHCFVPHHIRDSILLYLERGIPPGSFVQAVFANDLMGAYGKADHINQHHIKGIASWIYNFAPSNSHGSYEAIRNYVKGVNDANEDAS